MKTWQKVLIAVACICIIGTSGVQMVNGIKDAVNDSNVEQEQSVDMPTTSTDNVLE